ncbi:MAG: hypothetical protein ABL902_04075 [Gallionella sp.]
MGREFYEDNLKSNRLKNSQRAILSYAIRRMGREDSRPFIFEDNAQSILQNTTLPPATEQLDNLILYLGKTLEEPGALLSVLEPNTMRATLGAITATGADWVLQKAIQLELVEAMRLHGGGIASVTLSISGWQRFTELLTSTITSRRAFMAMKFGDEEMNNIFTNCFKPAAARAGYNLVKLDDEPRAGLIDDRLRLEIRTSRFLIADLSHANKGAYWEAGYAEGLGRPVIYTCKTSVFEHEDPNMRPHFDTNHYLTVPWDSNELQLAADKLTATIRVTLPSEAKLVDE